MKHLILKLIVLLLLVAFLINLTSCTTQQKVHRIARKNTCPTYKSAYLKWNHHSTDFSKK